MKPLEMIAILLFVLTLALAYSARLDTGWNAKIHSVTDKTAEVLR